MLFLILQLMVFFFIFNLQFEDVKFFSLFIFYFFLLFFYFLFIEKKKKENYVLHEEACFLHCTAAVAYRALSLARFKKGETLLVTGFFEKKKKNFGSEKLN